MIASTCLAIVFVPSLFVFVQRIEEWRKDRKRPLVLHSN
jgi:HAE1 family hydrophobic/amphiphilic exporter-1